MTPNYDIFLPDRIDWTKNPRGMPGGYQQAAIEGNPRNGEEYVFRARLAANWRAMPHYHPTDEHITVLEGAAYIGFGRTFDERDAVALPAASYVAIRAGAVHFFFSRTGCVIQVHGCGPQRITYVDPRDDPRNFVQRDTLNVTARAAG